ncbi:MAG: hypothetical protein M1833_002594 [Piccolia ochrophora]|nr:MAG: hypothetical protein M1833_002594 [Piccolia ochrophora]
MASNEQREPSATVKAAATAGVGNDPTRFDDVNNEETSASEGSTDAAMSASEKTGSGKRSTLQIAIIMMALCMSVFLAALDLTIITTALPTISEHFGSSAGYTWIGSSYLLANAASTPVWGKLSDIWGRKPALLIAAAVFFFGSALCGAATSITMLIAGRAVQGLGGGGLIILVNICISDLFSMRNRATYFGIIGMVWALASAIGPIMGGIFTQEVSWRWCFYINLPCTGAVFLVLLFYLKLHTPKTPLVAGLKAIDWIGSFTIVGGTLMFLLGLEFGGVIFPWSSATVVCLIVFGLVTLTLFILNEWKLATYPVMPLRLFAHRSNCAALLVCLSHGLVFIAGSYYLPLYFQAVLGASPLLSGVYLIPFALTLSLGSAIVGIFIRKTGRYLEPIWTGMALMTLGFGLFIDLSPTSSWAKIILYQIVAGLGVGPNFQSPLIALQSMIAPRDIATATATFGFTRNLATAISVVIGGVVFQNGMQAQLPALRDALGPDTAELLSGGSAGANVMIVAALPEAQRDLARQAFAEALRKMWILFVALGFAGMMASAGIGKQVLSKEHEETKTGLGGEEERRNVGKSEDGSGIRGRKEKEEV